MSKKIEVQVAHDRNYIQGVTHDNIGEYDPDSFMYRGDTFQEIIEEIKENGSPRCKKFIEAISREIGHVEACMDNSVMGKVSESFSSCSVTRDVSIDQVFLGYESSLQYSDSRTSGEWSRHWMFGKKDNGEEKAKSQTCFVEDIEVIDLEDITQFQGLSVRWSSLPSNLETMITLHQT